MPSSLTGHTGWSAEELETAIQNGPPPTAVDAFAQDLFEEIRRWRSQKDRVATRISHQIRLPTLRFRRPTRTMIELGLGRKFVIEAFDD